eukprot:scaffold6982_cov449-Prasinococcus_capsulatus_cf.AAC.7
MPMGSRFVLFTYRQNKLARWISSLEQTKQQFTYQFMEKPNHPPLLLIDEWETLCDQVREARHAAEQYGMRCVLPNCHTFAWFNEAKAESPITIATGYVHVKHRVLKMDFMQMVSATCEAAKEILYVWLNDVERSEIDRLECLPQVDHRFPHPEGLVDRVGLENALEIERQLNGTAYEWMLDLHATSWPPGHEREACFECSHTVYWRSGVRLADVKKLRVISVTTLRNLHTWATRLRKPFGEVLHPGPRDAIIDPGPRGWREALVEHPIEDGLQRGLPVAEYHRRMEQWHPSEERQDGPGGL